MLCGSGSDRYYYWYTLIIINIHHGVSASGGLVVMVVGVNIEGSGGVVCGIYRMWY